MTYMRFFLLFFFLCAFYHQSIGCSESILPIQQNFDDLSSTQTNTLLRARPNPLRQLFFTHKAKNKKITAAILAFPLPFGIVGLHRIYLGCAPFIPVVYIASLGGAFGILPLVDFFVILKEQDISKFNNSTQVFMWVE